MKSKMVLLSLFIAMSLSGCASLLVVEKEVAQITAPQISRLTELEKLMAFATRFSTLSDQEKQVECNQLMFQFYIADNWQAGWALAYVISDFQSCGTITEGLEILYRTRERQSQAGLSLWLINYQISLLSQLKQIKEQNQKLQQSLELTQQQLFNTQDDKNIMVLKLLELKKIETSINQRLEDEKNETN